jgi:hypothetical protein
MLVRLIDTTLSWSLRGALAWIVLHEYEAVAIDKLQTVNDALSLAFKGLAL